MTELSERRAIALTLHEVLSEIDPARWRDEKAEALKPKLTEVRARVQALEEPVQPKALIAALDAELPALDAPASDLRSKWLAFKKRMQPAYQALAQELRESSIHVPSLRPTNYARNLFHMTSATAAVLSIELLPWSVVTGIAITWAAFAWSCEISRRVSPKMNALLMRLFDRVAHPHEAHRVNSATWYASALLVLSFTHSPLLCMTAVAVLGVGDPMAALIGKRFGRVRLLNGRSLEGSLAFVVSAALVVFGLLRVFHGASIGVGAAVLIASITALAGAIAELVTQRLDDNLTIPLSVGAGAAASALLLSVPL